MKQTERPAETGMRSDVGMLICQKLREGVPLRRIQHFVRYECHERVTMKTIEAMKKEYEQSLRAKKFFKQKSSDIVEEFLEESRKGADVTEVQAALTQAMYADLLRRHLAGEKAFADIPTKDLYKIAGDQRKLMIRNGRNGNADTGITPFNAIYLLDLVEESMENQPALKEAMAAHKPALVEKLKSYFDSEEFRLAREEYEVLQEIREEYERTKNGDEKHAGMAG